MKIRNTLFKHTYVFFSGIIGLTLLMGFYFYNSEPIEIDKHILIKLEKRVDNSVEEKPYLLVLEWSFPEGSKLYNPKEQRRFYLEHSLLSGTKWKLADQSFGIAPNQKTGMLAVRYSTADSLNQAYNNLNDRTLWKQVIKNPNKP